MPYTLRLHTIATIALPITALADNSVTLSGIVISSTPPTKSIKARRMEAAVRMLITALSEVYRDPTFFSRMGLNIREELGGGLAAISKIEYAFASGTGVNDVAREKQ